MKKSFGLFLAAAMMMSVAFVAQPALAGMASKAVGTWRTPTGSVIRITGGKSSIVGTIVSVRDKSRRDSKNPNAKLRKRKLPGVRIFRLKRNGADAWKGSLYNTENGKTYSGHVKVLGANKIKLSGCVLGILCKSQIWTRR